MKIHIKNGRLVDPKNAVDAERDVFIAAGKVVAIGEAPADFHANRVIDAAGLVVCPGLVDLSARLREPGYEYKATLESEMLAAVAGGVTSLVCPPDTDPPLDEPGLVEMLKHRARSLNQARVYPLGALTQKLEGERLTEMAELSDAGCIAFSHADAPLTDTNVLLRAMQYAATFGFTVWLRPQDAFLAKGGVAHDGEVATRLGLPAIPACAETIALAVILQIMRETGAKVHICRLSTREAVEMVRAAKREGLPVTCDIAAHQAHLSETDLGFFDSHCHLVPPLRALRDRDALRPVLLSSQQFQPIGAQPLGKRRIAVRLNKLADFAGTRVLEAHLDFPVGEIRLQHMPFQPGRGGIEPRRLLQPERFACGEEFVVPAGGKSRTRQKQQRQ